VPPFAARAAGALRPAGTDVSANMLQGEWRCYRLGAPDSDMHPDFRRPDSLHLSVAVAQSRR